MKTPELNSMNFLPEAKDFEQSSANNLAWLSPLRQNAAKHFLELGIPTIKNEEWKYTDTRGILERKFYFPKESQLQNKELLQRHLNPQDINIVFVNGHFSSELSETKDLPKGISIVNIGNIAAQKDQDLASLINKYDLRQDDAFCALNNAFLKDGTFIKVSENVIEGRLIHIIHLTDTLSKDSVIFPRTLILAGKSSETKIIETYASSSEKSYLTGAVSDVFLAANAKLHHYKIQSEGKNAFHIGATRAFQERDSHFESFSLSVGGKLVRNNLSIVLNGEGADAVLNGLYSVTDHQHIDNHTSVDHRPPNCTSNQLYKGILDGHARAVFNGKIFVRREAQKTNSYQLNKNLLLGAGCQVDTKPQLEIFADDVKCTHGATIGQLDEDELFYLETRAIPKKLATKMLSRGFVNDILDRVESSDVKGRLDSVLTSASTILQ
ncbi:MAG: Fe-S cluster assembly protein SufD [Candidatus Omnitrophota bacterium]